MFSLLIALFISASAPAADYDEAAVCSYYLNLQNRLHCPSSGYLLGGGYFHCMKYVEKDEDFSLQGRRAMAGIRRCLVDQLQKQEDRLSCGNVEEIGFSTHTACYVANGFCDLGLSDKATVLFYGRRMLGNARMWKQMREIQAACAN